MALEETEMDEGMGMKTLYSPLPLAEPVPVKWLNRTGQTACVVYAVIPQDTNPQYRKI